MRAHLRRADWQRLLSRARISHGLRALASSLPNHRLRRTRACRIRVSVAIHAASRTCRSIAGVDGTCSSNLLRKRRGGGVVDAPFRIAQSRAQRAEFPARLSGSVRILLGANRCARELTRVRRMKVSRGLSVRVPGHLSTKCSWREALLATLRTLRAHPFTDFCIGQKYLTLCTGTARGNELAGLRNRTAWGLQKDPSTAKKQALPPHPP